MSERPSDVPEWAWERVGVALAESIEREVDGIRISKTLLLEIWGSTARELSAERERCASIPMSLVRNGFALSDSERQFAGLVEGVIRSGE